jgi:hypothetical protein
VGLLVNGNPLLAFPGFTYGSGAQVNSLGAFGLALTPLNFGSCDAAMTDLTASFPESGCRDGSTYWLAINDGGIAARMFGVGGLAAGIGAAGVLTATVTGIATVWAGADEGHEISATLTGAGTVVASISAKGSLVATVVIGFQPSAGEINLTLLDSPDAIEAGVTLRQALRLLLAVAAGKTTITPGQPGEAVVKFRNVGDTKVRIEAEMVGSERVDVTTDGT